MALKYHLIDNHLPGLRGTMRAVTVIGKAQTLDDVIEIMLSRGSTLTRGEILAMFEELASALERLLRTGASVTLPQVRISPSIVGRFRGIDDQFDRSRHRVDLKMTARRRLKEAAEQITVQKISGQRTTPVLLHFHDHATGEIDTIATIGGLIRISGKQLKFNEDDTRQGVFFINVDNARIIIRIGGKVLRKTVGELILELPPNVPAGQYKVEVRTIYKGNKRISTGVLPAELTVRP